MPTGNDQGMNTEVPSDPDTPRETGNDAAAETGRSAAGGPDAARSPDSDADADTYSNEQRMTDGATGRVIVLGNEKGGTGKSTTAMHLIVALMRDGNAVASIDLDSHQGTLTRYVENRRTFAESKGVRLPIPDHHRFSGSNEDNVTAAREEERARADAMIDELCATNDYVVLDCPGTDNFLARHVISRADTLVTPVNDSFVDLDLLARVGGSPPRVLGPSVYSQIVWEQRQERAKAGDRPIDWIVVRNRLSPLESRNKKNVGLTLDQLAERIGFRYLDGFYERVIFRQLFLQGLTVLDLRDEGTEVALNLSHVAARQEIRMLVDAVQNRLPDDEDEAPSAETDQEPPSPMQAAEG